MEFIYSLEIINGTFTPVRKGEIIRCKDCRYASPEGRENVYVCYAKKNPNYCWFDEYCSCGEKREETE